MTRGLGGKSRSDAWQRQFPQRAAADDFMALLTLAPAVSNSVLGIPGSPNRGVPPHPGGLHRPSANLTHPSTSAPEHPHPRRPHKPSRDARVHSAPTASTPPAEARPSGVVLESAAPRQDLAAPMSADTAPERSVCLVSLGCSKNLVDSEVMAGHLGRAGLGLVTDPEDSDLVIVNTCGFIDDAREESVETVLRYAQLKRDGVIEGLVVTGCLVELHEKQLAKEIPEVDAFLPLSDYSGVPSVVDAVLGRTGMADPARATGLVDFSGGGRARSGSRAAGGGAKGGSADLGRALLTPVHTAYLRLGEGCNHICAFCAIPKIRGKLSSKPLEVLVEEARSLVELGTRELSLVAEDSTDYGKDLKQGYGLAELLQELGRIEGLRWVRVLYAHPATFDDHLAATMASVPNVLPYLDMPVQHGDATVLKNMRRGTSPERIRDVVARCRDALPDLTLRTTILVGFPGETERRFGHLMELLEELQFDRVGCFVYSPEEGTEGTGLGARPSRRAAEARREQVMRWQRELLQAANKRRLGGIETVLVDAVEDLQGVGGQLARARSARDAPEIDGQVLVRVPPEMSGKVQPGMFLDVKLTGIKGYDVLGSVTE